MIICKLPTGDIVYKYNRCLVVPFTGKRKVMSTSMHNGGYREDLTAVYNHDVNPGPGRECEHCKPGQEEKIKRFIIDDLGLDYDTVAYMATIVSMDSAAFKTETYDELTVTAIATASLEVNGGRVGEPATSYEKRGQSISLRPGTINIMVFVNADMTPGCLARSMVTATEAKTAVLQELLAGSLYSSGIATGSGTDNVMIIADAESDNTLTYAGKHGKLGELIGRLVMDVVRESLGKHMGLTRESQHSMLARLKRYGISEKSFGAKCREVCNGLSLADGIDRIHVLDSQEEIVSLTSLYVHLLDQLSWGLLSVKEAVFSGKMILQKLAEHLETTPAWTAWTKADKKGLVQAMLDSYVTTVCLGTTTAMQTNGTRDS
ncbi:adenosylcobinamide amidohydrolase [Dehalobacter sp. DCM]|uniref:adenosylcobinamide amidohydrolase n=1 Tax=Dehalobacter sp. DCM TaxID=2907827 RepID=UPI0030816E7C|nr:adenosylcobinamide amidohydrolase [Dehalobacter sp. DCM]